MITLNACNQQSIKTQEDQNSEVIGQPINKNSPVTDNNDQTTISKPTTEKVKTINVKPLIASEPEKPEEIDHEKSTRNNDIEIQISEEKKIVPITLSGQISLNTNAIKDKNVEIKSTVVYFLPNGYSNETSKNTNHVIASQNKRFVPSVLAIQKGSSVTFPNMDRILHNVFSVSNIQKFDLGLYSAGKEKTVIFDKAGIIYVHCNVHHSMQADILVLDTPYYTYVDDNGSFSLKDLPNKSGDLYLWHPRAKLKKISINEDSDINKINKTLNIVRKKIPLHMNKFGAPYRPIRKK